MLEKSEVIFRMSSYISKYACAVSENRGSPTINASSNRTLELIIKLLNRNTIFAIQRAYFLRAVFQLTNKEASTAPCSVVMFYDFTD